MVAGAKRDQLELHVQNALGPALITTFGNMAPEVEQAFSRARDLCRRVGETTDLFTALSGLWIHHANMGWHRKAHALAEEMFGLRGLGVRKANGTP